MGVFLTVESQLEFDEVPWANLEPGTEIYYQVKRNPYAQGPFIVVDPKTCRLRNRQGVELNLPQVQPLVMKRQEWK